MVASPLVVTLLLKNLSSEVAAVLLQQRVQRIAITRVCKSHRELQLTQQLAIVTWNTKTFISICEEELGTVKQRENAATQDLRAQLDEVSSGALYGPYPIEALEHRRELVQARARLQLLAQEKSDALHELKTVTAAKALLEAQLTKSKAELANSDSEREGLLVEIKLVEAENAVLSEKNQVIRTPYPKSTKPNVPNEWRSTHASNRTGLPPLSSCRKSWPAKERGFHGKRRSGGTWRRSLSTCKVS